jgi:uncharacterized membrane protein YebE (DUF533 family)
MFDAKSILEALVKGAGPQQAPAAQSGGGLGDILGQLTKMAQGGGMGGGQAAPQQRGEAPASGGGLEDLLRQLGQATGGAGRGQSDVRHAAPSEQADSGFGGAGGLGDILGKLQQQMGGAAGGAAGGAGGLMDILGKVMGQATDGVREGAGRIGQATGASDVLGKAMGGQSGDDILAKLKELVAQNQFGAGAAAGGVGAVVLGTKAGRSMAASAAKLGALALIGGLAYKALLNYQNGQPLINGTHTITDAAPQGTGFEPQAVTNDSATLYIKAMIAAAAADGRIDQGEVEKITGGLKQAGLDAHAEEFLANELNSPAQIADIVAACQSPEEAVQVYTAARMAITPDSGAERAFLAELAAGLGIDTQLAAHIDAATNNAA